MIDNEGNGRLNDAAGAREPLGELEPGLRAALRARFGDGASDRVDWSELESKIVAAGRSRLDRRARRATGVRWGRAAIPAGLAATVLIALGLLLAPEGDLQAGPAIEAVGAVAASGLLPADPLFVTDQETFVAAMLDSSER